MAIFTQISLWAGTISMEENSRKYFLYNSPQKMSLPAKLFLVLMYNQNDVYKIYAVELDI